MTHITRVKISNYTCNEKNYLNWRKKFKKPEVEQSQRLYKFRIRKKFENPNERQRHSEKNENSNKAKVCTNPEFETKIQNRKQTLKKF